MLIANFNLTSAQLKVLIAFRTEKDTRDCEHHEMHDVEHSLKTAQRLVREGFLEWLDAEKEEVTPGRERVTRPPGYRLTPKGEMMIRIVEEELRTTLQWFDGAAQPDSTIQGAQHDVAMGKATIDDRGRYRRKTKQA